VSDCRGQHPRGRWFVYRQIGCGADTSPEWRAHASSSR
jgi:hypothetical protein